MKTIEALKALATFDGRKNAYRTWELSILFGESGEKLRSTIRRLLDSGTLVRAARGLYWSPSSTPIGFSPLEGLAAAARPGHFCFIGLESAASRWNVISQIPIDRLTVITTGREGELETPYGTIEFVHTKSSASELYAHTVEVPRAPLRLATKQYTVAGLLRAHRSLDLIDWEEVDEDE